MAQKKKLYLNDMNIEYLTQRLKVIIFSVPTPWGLYTLKKKFKKEIKITFRSNIIDYFGIQSRGRLDNSTDWIQPTGLQLIITALYIDAHRHKLQKTLQPPSGSVCILLHPSVTV